MADISDWRNELGATWARNAAVMERMLAPFGDAAIAALGPVAGRRVLDLGCGGGATTLALARNGAEAVGLDVSPDLVALAERRAREAELPVEFRCADAATARFESRFDALVSQFGAMFFDDTAAAFANLRGAMNPDARLAIACWRSPRENEWAMLALGAAKPELPEAPPADPLAPGPFAWAKPEASFAPALEAAGWRDVAWEALDHPIALGAGMEGDAVERAVAFPMTIGPLASRLEGLPEETVKRAEAAVRAAMEARATPEGVVVNGACWLVTARA